MVEAENYCLFWELVVETNQKPMAGGWDGAGGGGMNDAGEEGGKKVEMEVVMIIVIVIFRFLIIL